MIRVLIAAALLVIASQEPARERSLDVAHTAHSLRGFVVDAQTGSPVRRARVIAAGPGDTRVAAVSDAQGRFVMADVPAGRYTLSVSKPGHLTSAYGQTRHGAPGIPIDVPGEIADAELRMTISRGGVIPGRIVDERGEPVPLAQVRALQYKYEPMGRRLSWAAAEGSNSATDDLGGFRLYGLPPGRYFVVAIGPPFPLPAALGPGTDVRLPLMTYFPNTTDAGSAQPIVVAAGKETPPIASP